MSQGNNEFQYRIPHRINEPRTLIFFPIHHILPPAGLLFLGVLTGSAVLFFALGVAWFVIIKHVEERYPKGYLLGRMYWSGWAVFLRSSKWFPDPMKRNYYH